MNLKNLTLDEKLTLLTAKNQWETEDLNGKIPNVFMSDGPNGLRRQHMVDGKWKTVPSIAYPATAVVANTFSKECARILGESLGDDCIDKKADILLAPGVNIKRTPLCGRNFEYLSEDPYLAGELAYEIISGVQSRNVGTSLKHFACNNEEDYRQLQNSQLDDRTLYEIYLPAFERAIEADPWTIMSSYNMVNGMFASENKKLLTDILKNKLKYKGTVISDWYAVLNRPLALKAGLDIEMPKYGDVSFKELKKAYEDGFITDEDIDKALDRIQILLERNEKSKPNRKTKFTIDKRLENAQKIAEEGIVLLKNDNILPLPKKSSVSVFHKEGVSKYFIGGGSAQVLPYNPLTDVSEELGKLGYKIKKDRYVYSYDDIDSYKILCVAGEYNTEGTDRTSLKLTRDCVDAILGLAKECENLIVVLYSGSAIDCSEWIDKVKAVILAGYYGEKGSPALARIIAGEVNPSGKLAETFPIKLEDCPVKKEKEATRSIAYTERLYVGYRYYDTNNIDVLFPFGYGLSYSTFEYSNLKINKIDELNYEVSYDITNTSKVDGKEISQLYINDPVSSSDRPNKELKGFSKDLIKAGETKNITLKLNARSFAFYNPSLEDWYVENGRFNILIGSSSKDIKLKGTIEINLPKYKQYTQTFNYRPDSF